VFAAASDTVMGARAVSKADTWMPFYVGDYLSATGRLTTEQHGAYLLILLDYWKNGPPPADDAVLAALARMAPAAWRKAKPALMGFFEVRDGLLIQKRVEQERAKTSTINQERSKAGKAGAAKRWQTNKQMNGKPIANAIDLPLANGQQIDAPSQSHTCSSEQVESPNGDLSAEADPPITEDEVLEAWQDRMVPLGFPPVRKMTPARKRSLKARLREYPDIGDWQRAFSALERSNFCKGDNDRGWRADFDFLCQSKSLTKLIEGAYDH
jgi:uncharacterized protein YdaU (DUF1376 family)